MPRRRPQTIVANSLEELESLNRLMAVGEPDYPEPTQPDPTPPDEDDEQDPDEDAPDEDEDENPDDEDAPSPRAYARQMRVMDAWQYPGSMAQPRPDFVDPNWIGYAHYDELTQTPPGPILRVPTPAGDKVAHVGDYVVLQTIGRDPTPRLDVWPQAEFERIFGQSRAGRQTPRRRVA